MTEADAIPLLTASRIGRREPHTPNWLLREVSVQIGAGCRLAIAGPTGAGKTLLLRALTKLDALDCGDVLWRGKPIRGDSIPDFRRQVIYLQQRATLFEGTVEDNLRYPFTLKGNRQHQYCANTVGSLLQEVNRKDTFLGRSAADLSGGETQIVCVLRALQLHPTVLLLDEPTASLDVETTASIERLVNIWFTKAPTTRALVWVSHDKDQVARVASRVMQMDAGRLEREPGTSREPTP